MFSRSFYLKELVAFVYGEVIRPQRQEGKRGRGGDQRATARALLCLQCLCELKRRLLYDNRRR